MNTYYCINLLENYKYNKLLLRDSESINNKSNHFKNIEIINIKNEINFIEQYVNKLNFPYRNVLELRYFLNMPYRKIALQMSYSLQRIFQLRKKAIILISRMLKKDVEFHESNTLP